MSLLISRNPATGAVLAELEPTPASSLPQFFAQARSAQASWAALDFRERSRCLLKLREAILDHIDEITETLVSENGKPHFEAMANEVIPTLDLITFYARQSGRVLADRKIPLTLMKHRTSYYNYWPLGVVAVISPWNYPWLLPLGEIVMALAAGNAVLFKPSEVTPLVGLKLQAMINLAGFPQGLVQTLVGDGTLGAALIQNKPDKVFFTGSVGTGKKIMAQAAQTLTPVNLELGGKDAMIVLEDADLDFATSAALWGSYTNAGQMCASVERLLVHESIARPFQDLLVQKIARLKQGPSSDRNNDLGPVTFEKQKTVYVDHLTEAKQAGARFLAGGDYSADRRFMSPTLVTGKAIEQLKIYQEETFGPVVALSTFQTTDEAVQKANSGRYGLLGSVITRDLNKGEAVARRLQVGSVLINEVCYTAGLAETPWGGVKESGIGRTHSAEGLLEFVNIRHIHRPRYRWLTFKSVWWFPYTPQQYRVFRLFAETYRLGWGRKLAALPALVLEFGRFLRREKRL